MKESMQHEQLDHEIHVRHWERSQLLQLLHQKDAQLQSQHTAVSKQRAALTAARDTARHFRALCCLRAWRDHVQRLAWERQLSRARSRNVAVALRHACGTLDSSLKSATGRQMGQAMRKLWVHCALQTAQMPIGPRAVSSSAHLFGSGERQEHGKTASTEHPNTARSALGSPPCNARRVLLNELVDDEVLFATPGRNFQNSNTSPSVLRGTSPHLKSSHHRYCSPPSDDSTTTGAPSSSSQSRVASTVSSQSRVGISARSNPFTIVRLPQTLEIISRRRLLWALSRWRHFDASILVGENVAGMEVHGIAKDRCYFKADKSICEPAGLDRSAEQNRQADNMVIDGLRSKCMALECQVGALAGVETAQRARLQVARVREESLMQGNTRLEEELSRRKICEKEVTAHEEGVVSELRLELEKFHETRAQAEHQNEGTRRRCASSEELLVSSEKSCAALEAKLARRALWREKAEHHMREMAACGEDLEREQAQLLQRLAESREEHKGAHEQAKSLKRTLEHEEQAGEVLTARAWVLEEDNAVLKQCLQQEERQLLEEAARHSEELEVARRAEARVFAELAAVRAASISELKSADAARTMLMTAWDEERHQWSRHSSQCIAELQQQLSQLGHELQASRQMENTAADAFAQARRESEARDAAAALLPAELREEAAQVRAAARAEFTGEAELCRKMALQLEERLARAQKLQEGLEARTPPRCSSGFATPQLRELDAYAELVERLKTELGREREMRQATSQSLEALRSSYRLLLQRAGASSGEACA